LRSPDNLPFRDEEKDSQRYQIGEPGEYSKMDAVPSAKG
jgi:hypothetical protein